jgi:hypothetical protein
MSWPFGKKDTHTVVLVDIRSSSISAGYVVIKQGAQPNIIHSVQYPVDPHATEPVQEALPRTLETVLTALVQGGSQKVIAAGYSADSDHVLVSVSSPWQSSHIAIVRKEEPKTFTFSKRLLDEMTGDTVLSVPGRKMVSQLVLSTFLNGYETQNPFGREVKAVEAITLTTDIDESIYSKIHEVVRKTFHHKHIDIYAYLPELYAALKDVTPHNKDYLVFDVGADVSDIVLVKHGILISSAVHQSGMRNILDAVHKSGLSSHSIPTEEHEVLDADRNATFQDTTQLAKSAWIDAMKTTLSSIAKEEPLPRLVLVSSETAVSDFVTRLLDAPHLRSLWLSDEPLTLVPLTTSYFSPFVSVAAEVVPAIPMYVLALSAQKRYHS